MRLVIRPRPAIPSETLTVRPSPLVIRSRPLRVLDFDSECRPLHWIANDYVSKEITAIAWAWSDDPEHVTCKLLGEDDPVEMLRAFVGAFQAADVVTGHFILGHDLPLLNGALMEHRLPVLPDAVAHDTKVHLVKRSGISASQESLGSLLHLDEKKVQMNQGKWREANRLTPEGRALARERVVGDVRQHIKMRRELLALNYLGPARMWRSGVGQVEQYQP